MTTISKRRGAALMGVVIAIAVLTVLMAAVTWQNVTNRKLVQRRQHQLQCSWLSQSGVETAVARLLKDPAYKGEDLKPIESAKVKVTVAAKKDGVFQITSEARFPEHRSEAVVRSVSRQYRRVVDGGKVRMEAVGK